MSISSSQQICTYIAMTESIVPGQTPQYRLKLTFENEDETANFFTRLVQRKFDMDISIGGSCDRANKQITILSDNFVKTHEVLGTIKQHQKKNYKITEWVLSEQDNKISLIFINTQTAKCFTYELQKLLSSRVITNETMLASWHRKEKAVEISPILLAEQVMKELYLPPTTTPQGTEG